MNWEKARQTAAVAVCGAIVYAYLEFLAGCISNGYLPQTTFETGMVALQLAKLPAVLGVSRLRKAGLALTFDIFAVEMLFLPVLGLLYVWLGERFFLTLLGYIFTTWPLAAMLVLPIYTTYWLGRTSLRGGSLSSVLPFASSQFGFFIFLWEVSNTVGTNQGLAGFFHQLVGVLGSRTKIAANLLATNEGAIVASALLYVGLIAYVASGREPGSTTNSSSVLLLALLGTLTSLAWTLGLVTFTRDTLLLFAAPTLLTVTVVWWFARAR